MRRPSTSNRGQRRPLSGATNSETRALAAELVTLSPDVLIAPNPQAAVALKLATASISIVFVGTADPVGIGFVQSMSHPGGNMTGLSALVSGFTDADRARLDAILNQSAVNLRDRSATWQKSGWKTFDPASKPYDAEQVRKERQLYGGGIR